ncbi:hypothetical protein WJX72_009896 [[Myrmecia] bisecta]|uniref:Plastid lipid-associated protein/fibrillin conserved domain-containing protein n=1 Tax=[Myrmecia] bisecta TaxID=41462 RepID=A0AAW1Q0L5_9CHLO
MSYSTTLSFSTSLSAPVQVCKLAQKSRTNRRPLHHVCRPMASSSGQDASSSEQAALLSTRRGLLQTVTGAAVAALLPCFPHAARAAGNATEARQQLLDAIAANKGVEEALRQLASYNPTSKPALSPQLKGKWKLLWASDNSEVSIATRKLPIKGESYQYVGVEGGEKADRAANTIRLLGGAVQVYLSAAAVPDKESPDTVFIEPPFYLELKLGGLTIPIQNTQPGGERKQILGAERNSYKQLYLEASGKPGDLRISEVTFGDPSAQGSVFVHQRI